MRNSTVSDAIVLGRKIGTHEEWDEVDTFALVFYKFRAAAGNHKLPTEVCDLIVNYDTGEFSVSDGHGDPTWAMDIIEAIGQLPRQPPTD